MDEQRAEQTPGQPPAGRSAVYLTPLAHDYLDRTRPWVRFMSVVTFVAAGFMLLVGAGIMVVSLIGAAAATSADPENPFGNPILGGLMAVFYSMFAVLYIFPALYLHRYAGAIRRLGTSPDPLVLQDAIEHQKSFWRFVGILTVVALAISVVGVILAVLIPALLLGGAARS